MTFSVQLALVLSTMSLIPQLTCSYELQDTIHTLKEENAFLHHRLKNLTQALKEMKKLLLDHSHDSTASHNSEKLHAWNEWIKNGISAETHLMLEQAFCLPELHASAVLYFPEEILLVLSALFWIGILLVQIWS